jgi:hypothetical protein
VTPPTSGHCGPIATGYKHETAAEPVPADVSMPVPALPSRAAPTGVHVAAWVPPDPETLRRVKAALDRL